LRIGGSFSALLPGDIERAAEARLLQRDPAALAVDLLLTPHHGSRTSSTAPFVQAVAPAVVVHSAGWRSRFGHPRPEISERYAQLGAQQYTTGVSGAIRVWRGAPGAPLQVESRRAQAARWWNAAAQP
jgi:competence protein ComEC